MKLSKHEGIRIWVSRNRGVLKELARRFAVSQPFVTDVLYGRRNSRNSRVELALGQAGAPGFDAELARLKGGKP